MYELLTGSSHFQSSETRDDFFQVIKVTKITQLKANNSLDKEHEIEMNRIFKKARHKNKNGRCKRSKALQLDTIQFI